MDVALRSVSDGGDLCRSSSYRESPYFTEHP